MPAQIIDGKALAAKVRAEVREGVAHFRETEGRAPCLRMILVGDYEAQEAAQNLVHFPPDELSALGVFYDQVRFMREWTEKEDAAWNELALLSAGKTRLGAFDVTLLRRDLQIARNYEQLTVINSRRQIER